MWDAAHQLAVAEQRPELTKEARKLEHDPGRREKEQDLSDIPVPLFQSLLSVIQYLVPWSSMPKPWPTNTLHSFPIASFPAPQ